jgi:hypothetical protein
MVRYRYAVSEPVVSIYPFRVWMVVDTKMIVIWEYFNLRCPF